MRISFFYVHTIGHPQPIYTIVYIVLIKEYLPVTRPVQTTPELTLLMIAGGAER
jgi:hypothetical protein